MAQISSDRPAVQEDCRNEPGERWHRHFTGPATLERTPDTWRLVITNASAKRYTDAQIDDYHGKPRRAFHWRPPLQLKVRARFSHQERQLKGTAGFGFWNDPFLMTGRRWPALPRAVWFFFASSPSDMVLDLEVPGNGWKAMSLDALRWPFIALGPALPLIIPWMNIRPFRRRLWPVVQRAMRARGTLLDVDMTAWHLYQITWTEEKVTFVLDGEAVLDGVPAPRGPLGFVLWMDNQFAVATPWGRLGHGLLDISDCQWLEIDSLSIESD